MATYDPSYDPYGPDRRARRDFGLDFRAIFAGTMVGWGLLLFLSLAGVAVGLAPIHPYAATDAGAGSGAWAAAATLASSVLGGFLVVRLAGERRSRSGRMEAIVSWALSMIAGTLFAFATAANTAVRTDEAAIAAAAALIALVGAMGGATVAARRRSDRETILPAYFREEQEELPSAPRGSYQVERDEPTILPPTH
ncbi:MAG: hypothetical protein ACJ79M_05445 [Myxococcales bacterium]